MILLKLILENEYDYMNWIKLHNDLLHVISPLLETSLHYKHTIGD
jgi:hypothetical protein